MKLFEDKMLQLYVTQTCHKYDVFSLKMMNLEKYFNCYLDFFCLFQSVSISFQHGSQLNNTGFQILLI